MELEERFHLIEGEVRFLTSDEGGRQSPVWSGYRGQFYYGGDDHDGIWVFPELEPETWVTPGITVKVVIALPCNRWAAKHSNQVHEGMSFEGREGPKIVAVGTIRVLNGVVLDRKKFGL